MSGHSKWAKIKRAKGANDTKRGALFTKLGKTITLAAKEGGGDPDMNFTLRLAIDKAKEANMPSDNIDRAIKRGTGEDKTGAEIVSISYEAFGPNGTSMIIDCSTDNTNRTIAEVKKLVEVTGGKMAEINSVGWKFSEKGSIVVDSKKLVKSEKFGEDDYYVPHDSEEIEMILFEIPGIEDITRDGEIFEIITQKTDFAKILDQIKAEKLKVIDAELAKIPSDYVELSSEEYEKVQKVIEAIEEYDDVDTVWTDVKEL